MKKKIIKFAIVGAIAIIGTVGYNFTVNQDNANFQFSIDNVEALARGEGTSSGHGKSICYNQSTASTVNKYLPCGTCIMENGTGITKGGYCKW